MSTSDSPEVLNLRKKQEQAYDDWIDACIKHRDVTTHPEVVATQAAYDETVNSLIAMLGENAHCNLVDIELYSLFSDFYKDRNGFRPRHLVTRAECQEFLASLRDKPADEADILS